MKRFGIFFFFFSRILSKCGMRTFRRKKLGRKNPVVKYLTECESAAKHLERERGRGPNGFLLYDTRCLERISVIAASLYLCVTLYLRNYCFGPHEKKCLLCCLFFIARSPGICAKTKVDCNFRREVFWTRLFFSQKIEEQKKINHLFFLPSFVGRARKKTL